MKISVKDVASGLLLLSFALIGLWLNMDHTLGTARRMGPGYMPMLALVLMLLLGAVVLGNALFSGPDPLEKWSRLDLISLLAGIVACLLAYPVFASIGTLANNWYALGLAMLVGLAVLAISPGWRVLAFVSAAMTVFGLLLDSAGLFVALTALIVVSAFADRTHRPLGVAGLVVFLVALCWWVFIKELDIRVAIWPVL